ncbi:MAG: CDP-diacylglycerol--serine O-phosphatidyltransferase [Bdellovibrionales bacterium]|nr:CDP-diacylglycerol--serine O-phosphatidyltransferase [Bdellovibrionales bacterium]
MKPRLGGGIYLLPNLLTTGNLFFGFFAVVKALSGSMFIAACCLFVAAIFDVLDGRVARLTGATSEFGVQYDSLCDFLSFGIAPAIIAYQYALVGLGRIGWVLCFVYVAGGALRLARFNVQSAIGQSTDDFIGLPIPMAAGVIGAFVALREDVLTGSGEHVPALAATLLEYLQNDLAPIMFLTYAMPFLAIVMVSNFAYQSHKVIKIRLMHPFKLLVIAVGMFAVIAYEPLVSVFILTVLYAISGPAAWVIGLKKILNDGDIFATPEMDESIMEPGIAGLRRASDSRALSVSSDPKSDEHTVN